MSQARAVRTRPVPPPAVYERINKNGSITVRISYELPDGNTKFERIGQYDPKSATERKELWNQAIARIVERRAQIESGEFRVTAVEVSPDGPFVKDTLDEWAFAKAAEVRSAFTKDEAERLKKTEIADPVTGKQVAFGDLRVGRIDARLVESIRLAVLSSTKKNGSPKSNWTLRHTLSALKRFVNWLRETGYINPSKNPVEFLRLPKKPRPEPEKGARTPEEIAVILNVAERRIAQIAELMLLGGGRRLTEVCDLTESMIDWKSGVVNWWDNKNQKTVTLPLHPPLEALLKELIAEKDIRWERAMRRRGKQIERPEHVVLMRNRLRGYITKEERKALSRSFCALSKKLGTKVTTRFARKSVATFLAAKGLSDNAIIALTGHANTEVLAHYRARKQAEPGTNALTELADKIKRSK